MPPTWPACLVSVWGMHHSNDERSIVFLLVIADSETSGVLSFTCNSPVLQRPMRVIHPILAANLSGGSEKASSSLHQIVDLSHGGMFTRPSPNKEEHCVNS